MSVQQIKPRSFAWSYSRLKNFETCPRRYSEVDLHKSVEEAKSQELERGDALHAAMYSRVASGVKLPPEFVYMEKWAEKFTRELHPLQIIQCELKLAVDKSGNPVGFFERGVWLRGRIDYFRIVPTDGQPGRFIGHVVDYKTGKPKEDYTQLMLSAYLIFCHYKDVAALRTDFLWTEYNDSSHEDFKREAMEGLLAQVTPRVTRMELAHAENKFEPSPCGLCYEYCPVSQCEYHGKRVRRA
jgi:RecB family exonuclease